jgi:AraC-like DNA-binding protein
LAETPPDHAAVWVHQLIAELHRRNHAVEPILRAAGLDRATIDADGARIPITAHATVFELAAQTVDDDCLGLRFGATRDARDAGLIGYLGIASQTLGDALRNLSRYSRVFTDAVEFDIGDLTKLGDLRWAFRVPPGIRARQMIEFSAANVVQATRQLTGRNIVPIELTFAHPRNEHLDAFDRFFGCKVLFGEAGDRIRFRQSDLLTHLVHADDRLLAILRSYCDEILGHHAQKSPPLVEQVERLIVQRLTEGEAKADTVAAELGMTRRTLTRKLADLGTSFQSLLESLRKELAQRYLRDSGINMAEIAFLLGYTETSTFNHAFKRWTGKTPRQMRREARAKS